MDKDKFIEILNNQLKGNLDECDKIYYKIKIKTEENETSIDFNDIDFVFDTITGRLKFVCNYKD